MNYNDSLVNLFEQQVALNKEQTAISFKGKQLTYKTLNEQSNQVAHYLLENGVNSGDIIGLLFDRSTDFIVALWGVLKAGATYLPLDPDLPAKRIEFMLDKCNTSILIAQNKYEKQYADKFTIYTLDSEDIVGQPKQNLGTLSKFSDPAYCIFTSGSSGRPKGVLMQQRSVVNLVTGLKEAVYDSYPNPNLRVALIASFSFDASVQQIFSALLLGHSLYIADDDSRKDGVALQNFYNEHGIDISDGTPTHLRLLVKASTSNSKLETLSTWLIAGEILTKNAVNDFYEQLASNTILYNLYGPTETCVDSTYFKIDSTLLDTYESIPIGKPFVNERVYVTDEKGMEVPDGVVGELCIAGEGLAQGYINDPVLTKEKFKDNWVNGENRVYCTGDMVKKTPAGNLLYHGRVDNQIKLRGLRIELSEIEFQMIAHPLIDHAIVIVKEMFQEEQLAVYYEAEKEIDAADLREYLLENLPTYMVPSHFLYMDHLPMTVSGKVDRHALPDIEVLSANSNNVLTEVERKLITIWEEILDAPENWVGLETNFFQLGGNSLKSLLIANRIKKEFGVEISLAQFFELQTIAKFSEFIAAASTAEQNQILPVGDVDVNAFTTAQKCFYFINAEQNNNSIAYNIPQVFKLNGPVSLEKLNKAFKTLIQRYEILRTSYINDGENVQTLVADNLDFGVQLLVFENDLKSTIFKFLKPFDLSQGALMRAGLLKTSEEESFLILDIHHIISDEASNRILIKDLLAAYRGETLPKPRLQYKDYSAWQENDYYQNLAAEHKKFWMDVYEDNIQVLDLPTDYPRPLKLTSDACTDTVKLDKELCEQIRRLSREEGTTVYNFLFAIYYIFLSKVSNQEDIIVGVPVSGRHHVDLEEIVGLFVNSLAIRNYPEGTLKISDFISKVQKNMLQALDNQFYPYIDLVDTLKIPRDVNRNPLFDVCFNYNQRIKEEELDIGAFKMTPYDLGAKVAKFDLTLDVIESKEEIELSLIGRVDLYKQSTIERFSGYLKQLIKEVVSDTSQLIKDVTILPESEKNQLLSYNQSDETGEMSILEVFSQQVEKTPDKEAIVFNSQSLTYRQLDEQSNQLAHYLITKKVDQQALVGIQLDRSMEMIISLLAILKMGSAYVPLDPEFPESRIAFQLEDAGVSWVLTSSKYASGLKEQGCEVIALDLCWNEVLSSSSQATQVEVKPDDLMYIIYTSGSTGRPKGVLVEHKGLVNMTFALNRRFNMTKEDRILQFARITFDASISEILMAFFSGATLVLVEKETIINGESILDYMKKHQVSFAFFTPAYLKVLDNEKLKFLRCIISGGESASVEDLQYLSKHMECHNVYGPTECSAIVSGYQVNPNKVYSKQIPIGTPFRNLKFYILDKNNALCPFGVLGELCVGGIGVTRGYLNRPMLTDEKFVVDPFDPSKKMYRTGDYAKWNTDGQVEYIGRKDNQIKIRGFRIELGEIETVLNESDLVTQASIQVIEDEKGNKQIVGYVVSEEDVDTQEIQNYLGEKLPSYMKPSFLFKVDKIPLTSHGKVDRKKLMEKKALKPNLINPTNQLETQILDIWSKELSLASDEIGTSDNFFGLGGNSLNAMQIVIKINAAFNTKLNVSDIFRFQTITQLAKQVELEQWLDNSIPINTKEKRTEALL